MEKGAKAFLKKVSTLWFGQRSSLLPSRATTLATYNRCVKPPSTSPSCGLCHDSWDSWLKHAQNEFIFGAVHPVFWNLHKEST